MSLEILYDRLRNTIPKELILKDEPMKNHTSFKIGGPADILLNVSKKEHIVSAIHICNSLDIPFYIFGKGSNCLVLDKGIRGLVLKIADFYNNYCFEEGTLRAQAGASFSKVSLESTQKELTGLEFAVGIPGTVGGAINMNAGAYGSETKDVLESVLIIDRLGHTLKLQNKELDFSYRYSNLQQNKVMVLEATFVLSKGNKDDIAFLVDKYKASRNLKQPLDLPSAGSVFKRPPGSYAGKLIDEAGLRGYKVGDAQISNLHCGFIVNLGNASAADVIELIRIVKFKVKQISGVELSLELKIIGDED